MTDRENKLRAIRFECPDHIPMNFSMAKACWHYYDHEALFELIESHPFLFPGYKRPKEEKSKKTNNLYTSRTITDPFGCIWQEAIDGMRGVIIKRPLDNWEHFDTYKLPALPEIDVEIEKEAVALAKASGRFMQASLDHGHTFLRLSDICGYEKLLFDMVDKDKNLIKLIGMLEEYNYYFVDKWAKIDYDMIGYPEDLGMQVGPMISPEYFRTYLKPSYQRLMKPARDNGILVHMHSDGDIRTLADDLVDGGVDILNLQDLVNGIDWIKDNFAGKTCIDLDIDRQSITFGGTPTQIDALVREEVEKLSTKQGGLMMIYGLYPGVPLENIKALMDAMEKYAYFW
jgi:hypothetical protein